MTKPTVDLQPAHVWICPECELDNFCRGVVVEFSPEDRKEMDIYDPVGFWMTAPDDVVCVHCGAEFSVEND